MRSLCGTCLFGSCVARCLSGRSDETSVEVTALCRRVEVASSLEFRLRSFDRWLVTLHEFPRRESRGGAGNLNLAQFLAAAADGLQLVSEIVAIRIEIEGHRHPAALSQDTVS